MNTIACSTLPERKYPERYHGVWVNAQRAFPAPINLSIALDHLETVLDRDSARIEQLSSVRTGNDPRWDHITDEAINLRDNVVSAVRGCARPFLELACLRSDVTGKSLSHGEALFKRSIALLGAETTQGGFCRKYLSELWSVYPMVTRSGMGIVDDAARDSLLSEASFTRKVA